VVAEGGNPQPFSHPQERSLTTDGARSTAALQGPCHRLRVDSSRFTTSELNPLIVSGIKT